MTRAEQIRAVAKLGFTERQAGFLVTVLRPCRRLRRSPVLRLCPDRPRPEGARLLLYPGRQEVRDIVHRRRIEEPTSITFRQAAVQRRGRTRQPQPKAGDVGPRDRTPDGARRCARRTRASMARDRAREGRVLPGRNDAQAERTASPWRSACRLRRPFGTSPTSFRSASPRDGRTHLFLTS